MVLIASTRKALQTSETTPLTGHFWDHLLVLELQKIMDIPGKNAHIRQKNQYLANLAETVILLKLALPTLLILVKTWNIRPMEKRIW